jgi:hypothetical protein
MVSIGSCGPDRKRRAGREIVRGEELAGGLNTVTYLAQIRNLHSVLQLEELELRPVDRAVGHPLAQDLPTGRSLPIHAIGDVPLALAVCPRRSGRGKYREVIDLVSVDLEHADAHSPALA